MTNSLERGSLLALNAVKGSHFFLSEACLANRLKRPQLLNPRCHDALKFRSPRNYKTLSSAPRRRRSLLPRALLIALPNNPQTFQSQKFIHSLNLP